MKNISGTNFVHQNKIWSEQKGVYAFKRADAHKKEPFS